jgi:hypothetical protein
MWYYIMIKMCNQCYEKRFKFLEDYKQRLAEAIEKKETLLCIHIYKKQLENIKFVSV